MSDQFVRSENLHPGIDLVTLSRADKRNALNIALLHQLSNEIENLERNPRSRILILTGEGSVFCAGLDLVEAADVSLSEESAEGVRKVLTQLRTTPLIVICAAVGAAYAGGAGLLASSDLVVASDDFKLGFPEVRRGLVAAMVSAMLAGKVRNGDLRELLLLGEPISAQRAYEIGLIQWLVPSEQVIERATSIARTVAKGGPNAVRETKQLLNEQCMATDVALLKELHERVRQSDEALEGLAAFRERREPNWCEKN